MGFKLIKDERAMLFDDFLIVADLHIGYEKALAESGYNIPNQSENFAKKIIELKQKTGAKKLILLGDIKYQIPKIAYAEKYDVPNLFRKLSKEFDEIIITKGNHDGNIERMIHEDNVKIVNDYVVGNVGFTHGHRLPGEELMQCKTIVMGHIHPTFKFRDSLGVRHNYPCWLYGKLKKGKKFKDSKIENVIVVPCFNPYFSGYQHFMGPLSKSMRIDEIYLLDLTKVK
jgi:hypothetical protein